MLGLRLQLRLWEVINPRHACAGGLLYYVCLSVCLSVCMSVSTSMAHLAAKSWLQIGLKPNEDVFKIEPILPRAFRSRVMLRFVCQSER